MHPSAAFVPLVAAVQVFAPEAGTATNVGKLILVAGVAVNVSPVAQVPAVPLEENV